MGREERGREEIEVTWGRKMSGQEVVMDWMPEMKGRVKMVPELLLLGPEEQATAAMSSFPGKPQFCF